MSKIYDIIYSLKLNYKSWIFFMITIYLLSSKNYMNGVFNIIINFLIVYLVHYLLHINFKKYKFLNLIKIIHERHHNKHLHKKRDWFIIFTEILSEFFSITFISFIKIFTVSICNIHFFDVILNNINIPLNIFIFFLYTSLHYINYSYLHLTNYHEIHHIDYSKNLSPDICDIIFDTKYKKNNKSDIENIDHYIPNIIISTIIIYIFLYFYNNYNNKKIFDYIFIFIYMCILLFLSIVSIDLLYKKHNNKIKKYKNKIKKYKNEIKKYKDSIL